LGEGGKRGGKKPNRRRVGGRKGLWSHVELPSGNGGKGRMVCERTGGYKKFWLLTLGGGKWGRSGGRSAAQNEKPNLPVSFQGSVFEK